MPYSVTLKDQAVQQVAALPPDGLVAYLAVHVKIAFEPWESDPYGSNPGGKMRTLAFGPEGDGFILFLVIDREQEVFVLEVLWP